MRRKSPTGSLAAKTAKRSSTQYVSLPTCRAVRLAAASSQPTSVNRRKSRRPPAFRAIWSSWPGSGQKPSRRPSGGGGSDDLSKAGLSLTAGTRHPSLSQGPVRLRARIDLATNRRDTGTREAQDPLPRRPNSSRACIGGIVAPATPSHNARDYGDAFRSNTEHCGDGGLGRGASGLIPKGAGPGHGRPIIEDRACGCLPARVCSTTIWQS